MKTIMTTLRLTPTQLVIASPVLSVIFLFGCAHDSFERRADAIRDHVENFYAQLKANRVEAAVHANERIEAIARELAASVRRGANPERVRQIEDDYALMNTAREAAAQNWIALGQYCTIKRQPDKARAFYRHVVASYTHPTERRYREQAARAIEDLNLLAPASPRTTHDSAEPRMIPSSRPTHP